MSAVNRATKGKGNTTTRRGRTAATCPARIGTVTVAWVISRDAASRVWPVAAGEGEVELRWTLDTDAGTSRCVLVDGATETLIGTGTASGSVDASLTSVHASTSTDEFAATVRGERVVYARTTVLSRVGIAGGRYEVVR
jgi:hypothetical protein